MEFICPCCGGFVGIAGFVLWLWMLIECITKEPSEGNDKIIWVLVIIFVGPIGALIYLLARRPQRIAEVDQKMPGPDHE